MKRNFNEINPYIPSKLPLLISGGTIANLSTTKVNPIVRRSNPEGRGRNPSLLMETGIIVARRATERLIAGKERTAMGEQGRETRTTDGKPEEGTSPERQMDKSGTAKSKKEEWQNERRLILLIRRERERERETSASIPLKKL